MRVGTSDKTSGVVNCRGDHPHACGDKELAESIKVNGLGSSPRVWGQVRCCKRHMVSVRIIPTRVGTRAGFWQID